MICPYCETKNSNLKECKFCSADLTAKRPKLKTTLVEVDAFKPQPELATYHSYDLLVLLRYLREERSKSYHLMRTVQKAPEEARIDPDVISFGEYDYRRITAHMRIIEGILIDRFGYKPPRVDDKLLNALKAKIDKQQKESYSKR